MDDEGEVSKVSQESNKKNTSSTMIPKGPYQKVAAHVNKLKRQGFFKQPWILIPLNLGNYHWVFVALLNVSYLGTPQDKKMTGFFYYDGMNPNTSHEQAMEYMHDNGILNLVIYANLAFGHPNLFGSEIKERIVDKKRFPKIEVPIQDFVEQNDGYNCGIFVWLCMLEMSLVHCKKYQKMEDFQYKEDVGTFFLQDGDWFKTFKDPKLAEKTQPAKTKATEKEPVAISLKKEFFLAIREQATVLINRIRKMRTKKHYDPWKYNKVPPYRFTIPNIVRHIWNYEEKDQAKINTLNNWIKNENFTEADLQLLFNSTNPIVSVPEAVFGDDKTIEDSSKESSRIKEFTNDELQQAGMKLGGPTKKGKKNRKRKGPPVSLEELFASSPKVARVTSGGDEATADQDSTAEEPSVGGEEKQDDASDKKPPAADTSNKAWLDGLPRAKVDFRDDKPLSPANFDSSEKEDEATPPAAVEEQEVAAKKPPRGKVLPLPTSRNRSKGSNKPLPRKDPRGRLKEPPPEDRHPVPLIDAAQALTEIQVREMFENTKTAKDFDKSQRSMKEARQAIFAANHMPTSEQQFDEWVGTKWRKRKNETRRSSKSGCSLEGNMEKGKRQMESRGKPTCLRLGCCSAVCST